MITVKLLGGLGNQMFQRAYGIALEKAGYGVIYSRAELVEGTHREYSLGGFESSINTMQSEIHQSPAIYEAGMRYKELYLNPPATATMVGYWQTEQYFKNVIPQVLQAFKFKPLSPWAAGYLNEIQNSCCETAFLHVRRQDYVGLQHVHGLPTIDYYLNAVKELPKNVAVYVFSDDMNWCLDAFSEMPGFHFVHSTTKFEDLRLMKECRHAILANSSFSWWGAWLGDCRQPRTVIAPKQWFNPKAGIDDTDIVPERWRKM